MENGQLEFLGRLDDQFKIGGYRIEAGEIEIFLRRHTQIKEALVVSHRTQDDLVLLAYLVPKQGNHIPSPETLRNYLSEFLPNPMIPTLWHELEAILDCLMARLTKRFFRHLIFHKVPMPIKHL